VTRAVQEGGLSRSRSPSRLELSGRVRAGFGADYQYPHDFARGWVSQQYLPDALVGQRYYDPSEYGREKALVDQWRVTVQREDEGNSEAPVE